MRKLRENLPNRVYHLISQVAHRAFFLNPEERTRFKIRGARDREPGILHAQVSFALGGRWLYRACRQGQPLVVEARVQADAEGRGGGAMVTVSLRPYHKGLTLEIEIGLGSEAFENVPMNDFTELRNQIDARCG